MIDTIKITELSGVSETLLVTAYLRSLETKKINGIIKDYKSIEIIDRIDYDFSKYNSPINQALIAIRTEIIDEFVRNFVRQHEEVTIVSLGTGLCTRFFRINHGAVFWIAIDLPQVQPVWNSLVGETDKYQYLAHSVTDLNWITKVKQMASGKILFIAEGLLMFLSEIEVRYLITNINKNFAGSEMLFDSLGVILARNSRVNSGDLGIKTSYQWGIKNLQEIEDWARGIELVQQWYYLDCHKNRLGLLGWLSYIPILRSQVKIGHLHFFSSELL
jgi:O-methyltransferase involved in polyketide biosynthesis